MSASPTILSLAAALNSGQTTSLALTEAAFACIEDSGGEGPRAFMRVDREAALAQAQASDLLRSHEIAPSPLAGVPMSIKDLFDIGGQVTTAGSIVLKGVPPAERDALVVSRLRAAGAIILGRTTMTEFAYSGLGLNPHYGCPGNPFDRARVPGGSSSGAAVSVTDGMAVAAIGSDTGGSVRIPAAFCGLVGFKPSQERVPREGVLPLSWSLDAVGPIARTVACCAILDGILAGTAPVAPQPAELRGLRLGVPGSHLLEGLDRTVAAAFTRALQRLENAGAHIDEFPVPELDRIPELNAKGGLTAAEAYAWHRELLSRRGEAYDPRVSVRIQRGAEQSAADYIDLVRARAALVSEVEARTRMVDALLAPTVAIVPPRFDELEDDHAYARINALVLRNTSVWNFLDRPAISLPCASDGLPVGLMVIGRHGDDRRLLAIARAVESAVG